MDKTIKLNKNKELKELSELANDGETTPLTPYFRALSTGLFYHGIGVDKHGVAFEKPPVRVSDPFRIVGRGQDVDEREFRVIEYQRNGRGMKRLAAFPMGLVGRSDGASFLREKLGICIKERHKNELWDYVQWEGDKTDWQVSAKGGWTDDTCTAYILPSGEIIGQPENKVIFIGDTSKKAAYTASGSLKDWQEQIARYLRGNSRHLLALGAVFASPLLGVLKQEGGGFHFFGDSSSGKTLLSMVAFSAMGNAEALKVQWNGTSLAFDNIAAANNDGIIFLDELSQAEPKVLKDVGYSIFNGSSKLQGAAMGGNRTQLKWRVLAISTGEFDAERFLKQDGMEWNAGQAVRLPAIPTDCGKGLGTFDTLNGFESASALALHLDHAHKRIYGTAFHAFITELTAQMHRQPEKMLQRIGELQTEFMAMLPPKLDNQPARAAKRFTLAAVALELASEWGITGYDKGVGFAGVLASFMVWYERDGKSNREEQQILKATYEFLQVHGHSERFYRVVGNLDMDKQPLVSRHHAGFMIMTGGEELQPRFFINDTVFEEEICKGFDVRFVCKVLSDCGWLKRESDKRLKYKLPNKICDQLNIKHSTRMYCLDGFEIPNHEN